MTIELTLENYPLSINALTNACNQKINRDPVLNLSDTEVQQVVDALVRKHLVLPGRYKVSAVYYGLGSAGDLR